MFKLFFFIFTSFSCFSSISITAENLSEAKLLELFLRDRFYLESESFNISKKIVKSDINLVIIHEKGDSSLLSKVIYNKKEYIIDSLRVNPISIHGEILAYFSDKNLKIPYIVWTDNIIYINGNEVLENQILQKILIEVLNEKFDRLKIKETSKEIFPDSSDKKDISKITNIIILILSIGVTFFIIFLGFSVKNKFGNSFKGD